MNQLYSLYWPTKTGCNQKPLRGWHGCNMNKLAIQPQIEVFLPIDPANTGISCYWPITWGTGIHLSYGTAYCMLLRWQVTLTQAVTTNNTIYNMIIYMSYSINFMWHCTPSLLTYTCYYFGIPIYILYIVGLLTHKLSWSCHQAAKLHCEKSWSKHGIHLQSLMDNHAKALLIDELKM